MPDITETPKKCYSIEYINNEGKYYLSGPPIGNKYYLCQSPCKTWRLNKDNCFSCVDDNYFDIDNLNKCKLQTDISANYYLVKDTYVMKDSTCDTVIPNNNKKKCSVCATIDGRSYYKFKNEDDDFCYLIEELNYERGINIYLDESDTNPSNHKFAYCDSKCLICSGQPTNCLKCSENNYFITTSPGECQTIEYINNLPGEYYLPRGSDTYYQCDPNCVCELKNDHCISCTNGYILKQDENKCYPPTTELKGYYKSNNIFKKCHDSCLECDGEGPEKCTNCAPPYYPFQLNNINKRCITEIEKNHNSDYDNYYLKKDNLGNNLSFEKCDESCLTCKDGEVNNQCIKCNSEYAFYEGGGSICKKKNIFFNDNDNYYYNEYLEEFRKCHKSCNSCKNGDRYNNCYKCNTNDGYVFIDDPLNGKCVLESIFQTELKNYYLENVNDHEIRDGTKITVKVYKKCPENCDKCKKFKDNPLKCLVCNQDKGYYKHTLSISVSKQDECYNNSIIEHYYFNV